MATRVRERMRLDWEDFLAAVADDDDDLPALERRWDDDNVDDENGGMNKLPPASARGGPRRRFFPTAAAAAAVADVGLALADATESIASTSKASSRSARADDACASCNGLIILCVCFSLSLFVLSSYVAAQFIASTTMICYLLTFWARRMALLGCLFASHGRAMPLVGHGKVHFVWPDTEKSSCAACSCGDTKTLTNFFDNAKGKN